MVVRLNTSDPWITAKEEQPEVMRSLNRTAARFLLTVDVTIQRRYPLVLRPP
jgi:hypothetical protein